MGMSIYLVKKRPAKERHGMSADDWEAEQWEEVKSVHRMDCGYGIPLPKFAEKYADCDGRVLTHKEVKKLAREFEDEFNAWAKAFAFIDKRPKFGGKPGEVDVHYWLSSSPDSWVYDKFTKGYKDQFLNALRILNAYLAASALGYSLALH